MRRVRDVLWFATAVVMMLGSVLRRAPGGLFEPMPYTSGLLLRLALFGLLPLALLATVLAWPRLAVWLGIRPSPRRRGAPKHAPPPDGPTA